MEAFCIDLAVNTRITPLEHLEVLEYEKEDLLYELKEWKTNKVEDLTDYDRCVFSTRKEAEKFLARYKEIYETLDKKNYCIDRTLPSMAYRRRNIVQTLMGYKMQTRRKYLLGDWMPGMLFNLHDRTYFITVQLTSIEKCDGYYQYNFKLP